MKQHTKRQKTAPEQKAVAVPKKRAKPVLGYTDLDLNQWRAYDDILTDSLWMMSSREKQGGHALEYHGNCIPQILNQLIRRFTRPGELVLDLFMGSGTTGIEAINLGRSCLGLELNPLMVDKVNQNLEQLSQQLYPDNSHHYQVLNADSSDVQSLKKIRKQLRLWQKESVDFLFLHPPYDDIIRFSDEKADLSNQESTQAFLEGFEQVASLGYTALASGRFAALTIGDKYQQGQWIPLGFMCMQAMMQQGFLLKSIIVKNMTGNEKGKGKTANLWRYRALAGGFYVFKHEYVMLFQKP
jgi:16S rRNA G966 N2-methylase RsmD